MPTGHSVGSLAFVAHINDLCFPDYGFGIKYVDASPATHSSKNPGYETIQECTDYINDWTKENHMKSNAEKNNDMIFIPININGTEIERLKEEQKSWVSS